MKSTCITDAIGRLPKMVAGEIIFVPLNHSFLQSNLLFFNLPGILFSLSADGSVTLIHEQLKKQDSLTNDNAATVSKIAISSTDDQEFLLILFSRNRLTQFIIQQQPPMRAKKIPTTLRGDASRRLLLQQSVNQLAAWVLSGVPHADRLLEHKFREILLLLWDRFSGNFYEMMLAGRPGRTPSSENHESVFGGRTTIEMLAKKSFRSVSTFRRSFLQEYGITPGAYLRKKRLHAAAESLLEGKKIQEIYLDFGYGSAPNFIYAFRREFNCSPKIYIQRHAS